MALHSGLQPAAAGSGHFGKLAGRSRDWRRAATLHGDGIGLIFAFMQISDFFNSAGHGLVDTAKMVFFRMLPRGAQIEQVRAEINQGVLKPYGKITELNIDKENRIIRADLDLKGEPERLQITVIHYRLVQPEGENPQFEFGRLEASREWLQALLGTLIKKNIIPARLEIKNQLHQLVVKSIL